MNARRGLHRALLGVAAACVFAAGLGASAADTTADKTAATGVTLKIAWLRPAAAGMAEAMAYVDIVNETGGDLELVGASTPFAKKIELVQVTMKTDAREQKVVASMPVPGGKTTRLAYNGSHLRLVEITKDFGNGTPVPLTLAFKSAAGKDVTATINAQVRGMLSPQHMPATVLREPAPAAKEAVPEAKEAKEAAPASKDAVPAAMEAAPTPAK